MDFTDKQETETELMQLPELIRNKANEMVITRAEYNTAKVIYENKFATIYMSEKLKNPEMTQGDLSATSKIGSYQQRLDMILSESKYLKCKNEYEYLKTQYETALERSRTYRAEVKQGL